jgi:hypothetical protein
MQKTIALFVGVALLLGACGADQESIGPIEKLFSVLPDTNQLRESVSLADTVNFDAMVEQKPQNAGELRRLFNRSPMSETLGELSHGGMVAAAAFGQSTMFLGAKSTRLDELSFDLEKVGFAVVVDEERRLLTLNPVGSQQVTTSAKTLANWTEGVTAVHVAEQNGGFALLLSPGSIRTPLPGSSGLVRGRYLQAMIYGLAQRNGSLVGIVVSVYNSPEAAKGQAAAARKQMDSGDSNSESLRLAFPKWEVHTSGSTRIVLLPNDDPRAIFRLFSQLYFLIDGQEGTP